LFGLFDIAYSEREYSANTHLWFACDIWRCINFSWLIILVTVFSMY